MGFSHVAGDTAAIARIQRGSAHFFQRPDADHIELDPTRTSLSGWSAALRGGKRTGTWRWNHGVWMDSPGFELNDVGIQTRSDDVAGWLELFYAEFFAPRGEVMAAHLDAFLDHFERAGWVARREGRVAATETGLAPLRFLAEQTRAVLEAYCATASALLSASGRPLAIRELQRAAAEEFTRARASTVPLGRMERPEDVANVIGFLCSSKSGYMTGQALSVDGGLVMH